MVFVYFLNSVQLNSRTAADFFHPAILIRLLVFFFGRQNGSRLFIVENQISSDVWDG